VLLAPRVCTAAATVYTFSAAPSSLNRDNGTFTYDDAFDGPSATFVNFQHDDAGAYPDHTGDALGSIFGVGAGPAVVSFSEAVQLVELFVYNFSGDFDARPGDAKLFGVTARLAGADVFTYNRADASDPGSGVSDAYLRVAPDAPVLVDSLSFTNFDQDALDDLTVIVPEPGGFVLLAAGTVGGLFNRRRRVGT
jgi:hypothetical protein